MISSTIDLAATPHNSKKSEQSITDATEDLLSLEQSEFSVYASASLPQLQALTTAGTSTPQSLEAHIGKLQTRLGAEATFSSASLDKNLEAKAYEPSKLINLELAKPLSSERAYTNDLSQIVGAIDPKLAKVIDRGLPESIRLNHSNTLTEQQLSNQDPKTTFQASKQSQLSTMAQPVSNQVATGVGNALKGDINPQANLMLNQILQVNNQIPDTDPATVAITTTTRAQAAVSQWGPVSVSTAAPLAQQAQEMLTPLREQLRFQIDQKIKQAELRLDPPSLGKVELNIRLDGDRLHIQMHAANPNVRDSLLTGLERLREELAMDHGGQIELDIGQGEKERQPDERQASVIADHQIEMLEPESPQQDKQQISNQIDLLA
ncbi:flagellar hook-length control protein FliK [Shewanella sp. UCD-KL12]|uniref:flagellar hook-length control protein FliK n=1 Tax=Shewanella sp. UCD-KL12 TaxID=1917163 RepID=UPI0009712B1B|nr:flagellar hook-length control protein FliK [Shewanella sp. UCD-KL12]